MREEEENKDQELRDWSQAQKTALPPIMIIKSKGRILRLQPPEC